MSFSKEKIVHGFKLIEERKIEEINSTGRIFIHLKSGARLLYFSNDDDNKVFSVSFRTPPADHSGTPHILEHSVLCGSKKFPVKEPFVELAKGSLNTFLNAMTFSDKTMYPVASRNEKDLQNLMEVYLDAVFFPNIYENPQILMQEGWHYELENPESELNYVGVVYNEMKGVFSSPESILFRKIQESLFPQTAYGFESGGDPDYIPQLTQKKFIDFHRKYYHPANSYFYLYGNGDVLKHLEFIDKNYLSQFTKKSIRSSIARQKPFQKTKEIILDYPILQDENLKNKTYLSLNYALSNNTDPEIYLAFDILEHLLLTTTAAPLKKALLKAKLGKDVFGSYDSSIQQPVFSIVVKNSELARKDKFIQVVEDSLKNLVQKGIPKKLIEASLNIKEFYLREADFGNYPKGLVYNMKCLDSWLYNASPFIHLEYEKPLRKIKSELNNGYFESLIEKFLLKNNHKTMLAIVPQKGLEEKKAGELRNKLNTFKKSLSQIQLRNLVQETKTLKERQAAPDRMEDLKKIPLLSLKDLEKKVEKLPLVETEEQGVKILKHPIFTGNIAYVNMYFDAQVIPEELLPYYSLFTSIIGEVGTKQYNYSDLANEINIHTGGIDFTCQTFIQEGDDRKLFPMLSIRSKVLMHKLEKLFELLAEMILTTNFSDKTRIREIVQERKSRMEMAIMNHGHKVASARMYSYFSLVGKYNEILNGITFYHFISDLEKNFNSRFDSLRENLEKISNIVFSKKNLVLSVTLDENDYPRFQKSFPILSQNLKQTPAKKAKYNFQLKALNEGFITPGKVQFVAKGFNFKTLGFEYSGVLQVLKTIVSLDYLWNRVRVQGGAYGAFASFSRNGNTFFGSYRDPNLDKTLNAFNEIPLYLKNFEASSRQMTKYIIGTISNLDMPLSPAMKGEEATALYMSKLSYEELQKERDEILKANRADIQKLGAMLEAVLSMNCHCVLGNEKSINENKKLFKKTLKIFS